MGIDLSKIILRKDISINSLSGKIIALDGYNVIYQFLSTIRDRFGRPLKNKNGVVTSHLSGLFYRNMNLMAAGIDLIYVFDGEPPIHKRDELNKRKKNKEIENQKYISAIKDGNIVDARKYAKRTSIVDRNIIDEAKELLTIMGIQVIMSPSEGEAQASYMARSGDVWASASQDYDSILFGTPKTIRNLTSSNKFNPELIRLEDILNKHKITREQLIDIAILVGTDYNTGVRGLGPAKSLLLIQKHEKIEDIPDIHDKISLNEVKIIRNLFLDPKIIKNYKIEHKDIDERRLVSYLCGEMNFSRERVLKVLEKTVKHDKKKHVNTLDSWI